MKPRLKKFNKRNVSLSALILAVRAIAAEKPDFVYTNDGYQCLYRPKRLKSGVVSGCIIGEALRRIGISTAGLDTPGANGINTQLGRVGFNMNSQRVKWLGEVQAQQDTRGTWGTAVSMADKEYPLDMPDESVA